MSLNVLTMGGAGGESASIFVTGLSEADTVTAYKNEVLAMKSVGDTVNLNVDGVSREFIIVNQGNPDSNIYDASCEGTWLMLKEPYFKRAYHTADGGDYENSEIHAYLNSTFLQGFDIKVQEAIKQVKIPYVKGGGVDGTVVVGENGLSTKIFLANYKEINHPYVYLVSTDGAPLSYFKDGDASKRIAYADGVAVAWRTRSPRLTTKYPQLVASSGADSYDNATKQYHIRPFLILPPNLEVDRSGFVSGRAQGAGKTVRGKWQGDGHMIAPIKEYGMWTVTATNGVNAASRDVLIDIAAQCEVHMAYAVDHVLTADDFSKATTMVQYTGRSSFSIEANQYNGTDGLRIYGTNNIAAGSGSPSAISNPGYVLPLDLTGYSTLSWYFYKVNNHASMRVLVFENSPTVSTQESEAVAMLNKGYNDLSASWVKYTLDVSDLDGLHYVCFQSGWGDSSGNANSEGKFSNIWLLVD